MKVLDVANTTREGTWYKVDIGGQVLHVLSKKNLQAGQKLIIKKSSELKLEIVKDLGSERESTHQALKGPVRAEQIHPPDIHSLDLELQTFEEFMFSLALEVLRGSEEFNFSAGANRSYHFTLPLSEHHKELNAEGLFMERPPDQWELFLSLPAKYKESIDLKEAVADLKDMLSDIKVRQVYFTTASHIQALKGGVDLVQ